MSPASEFSADARDPTPMSTGEPFGIANPSDADTETLETETAQPPGEAGRAKVPSMMKPDTHKLLIGGGTVLAALLIAIAWTRPGGNPPSEPERAVPTRNSDLDERPGSSGGGISRRQETGPGRLEPKIRTRPSAEELSRARHERKREDLLAKIKGLREAGMGDRHPNVTILTDELAELDSLSFPP